MHQLAVSHTLSLVEQQCDAALAYFFAYLKTEPGGAVFSAEPGPFSMLISKHESGIPAPCREDIDENELTTRKFLFFNTAVAPND